MATTTPASPVSFQSLRSPVNEGLFYTSMGVFALFFCIAAFGPSIMHPENRLGPVTPLVAVHGLLFFAWSLLFIAQTILARNGNLALHRSMGMWSAILAAALVVLGYQTTIAMGRRGYDLSGDAGARSDPLAAMAFPLLDTFMFAVLFLAAYFYRHRSAIHKRLILLTVTGALMPSPITHLTGHFAFLRDKGFLVPLMVGYSSRRVRSTIDSSSVASIRFRSGLRSLSSCWVTCGL